MARKHAAASRLDENEQTLLMNLVPWALEPDEALPLRESHVVKQVCDFLEYRGWKIIRNHVGKFVPSRYVTRLIRAIEKQQYDLIPLIIADIRRNYITINEEGISDVLAVHPQRRTKWIEFKRPNGPVRPAQKKWIAIMRDVYHFEVLVVDNLEEFIQYYNETEGKIAA